MSEFSVHLFSAHLFYCKKHILYMYVYPLFFMLIFHTDASFFCLETDSPALAAAWNRPLTRQNAEVNDIFRQPDRAVTKDRKGDHIAAPVMKF